MRVYEADFPVPDTLTCAGGRYELEAREFRGDVYPMFRRGPRTLSELMADVIAANRGDPDARMTEQDGVITTYADFEARAAALARTLRDTLCVAPGDHVAITTANRVEWMIAFFAIAAAGAVPVLVHSRGVGEEMHRAIRLAGCNVSITDRERHERLVAHAVPTWRSILLDTPDLLNPAREVNFTSAATPVAGLSLTFARRDPEVPALVMFSSGTTGHPKAIVHSQGGVAHSLTLGCLLNDAYDHLYERQFGEALPRHLRNSTSTLVLSSPLFHVAGFLPYMRAIMHGQATLLVSKWNEDAVFDILARETVSRLSLVPTMIFDMLNSPRAQSGLLAKLRFLASGTAALSPTIAARVRAALPNCLMFNTFGQTETMERVATVGGREFENNLNAVGRVAPGTRLRILRDDGSDAEPGEPGEICVRSANTMLGYYSDSKVTADALVDGWLRTGDIGHFDERGLLYVIDRKKNMVICGGENIYCAEVERVLGEHPDAVEAIAFGEPDPRLGERLLAVVVLKPGQRPTEEAMKEYVRARLAIYKVPRQVSFTYTPLPRNATGKVARGVFLDGRKKSA